MDVVGLGKHGNAVASYFKEYEQYNVFGFGIETGGFKIEQQPLIEDYENNFDENNLKLLKDNLQHDTVIFCVCSYDPEAITILRFLESIKDKEIIVLCMQQKESLLAAFQKLLEKAVTCILQTYARSGLFKLYLFNIDTIGNIIGNLPILKYYQTVFQFIAASFHMINFFKHSTPVFGMEQENIKILKGAKIATIGIKKEGQLQLFFPFKKDDIHQTVLYYAINKEKLLNDANVTEEIFEQTKHKNIFYSVYETEYEEEYVYGEVFTSVIYGEGV